MIPATVPDISDVVVTVRAELVHRCPHVDEIDHGTIAITWCPEGRTFELHSLADYLSRWKDAALSHEQITDRIRADLSLADCLTVLSVETTWTTAGMEVTCATSPTPLPLECETP